MTVLLIAALAIPPGPAFALRPNQLVQNPGMEEDLAAALGAGLEEIEEKLRERLINPNVALEPAELAAQNLSLLGTTRAREILIEIMDTHPNQLVRLAAAQSLARHGDPADAPAIARAMNWDGENPDIAAKMAQVLGWFNYADQAQVDAALEAIRQLASKVRGFETAISGIAAGAVMTHFERLALTADLQAGRSPISAAERLKALAESDPRCVPALIQAYTAQGANGNLREQILYGLRYAVTSDAEGNGINALRLQALAFLTDTSDVENRRPPATPVDRGLRTLARSLLQEIEDRRSGTTPGTGLEEGSSDDTVEMEPQPPEPEEEPAPVEENIQALRVRALGTASAANRGIGRRTQQQDYYAMQTIGTVERPVATAKVLTDGFGDQGASAGATAAKRVMERLRAPEFAALADEYRRTPEEDRGPIIPRIRDAVRAAVLAVHEEMRARGRGEFVCSFVMAVIVGDLLTIAQVGDSRAYLTRGQNRYALLTRDHSLVWVDAVGKAGPAPDGINQYEWNLEISREARASDVPANIIYKFMGRDTMSLNLHMESLRLLPGDRLALCSDGVWGQTGDEGLLYALSTASSPDAAVAELMRMSENGGDNYGTVVTFYQPEDAPPPEELERDMADTDPDIKLPPSADAGREEGTPWGAAAKIIAEIQKNPAVTSIGVEVERNEVRFNVVFDQQPDGVGWVREMIRATSEMWTGARANRTMTIRFPRKEELVEGDLAPGIAVYLRPSGNSQGVVLTEAQLAELLQESPLQEVYLPGLEEGRLEQLTRRVVGANLEVLRRLLRQVPISAGDREFLNRTNRWLDPQTTDRRFSYVAREPGGTIVGLAAGYIPESDPDTVFMSWLVVDGPFQDQGFGTRLFNQVAQAARGTPGVTRMQWLVNRNNAGALEFYGKLGGQVVGIVPAPLGIESSYVMEMPLRRLVVKEFGNLPVPPEGLQFDGLTFADSGEDATRNTVDLYRALEPGQRRLIVPRAGLPATGRVFAHPGIRLPEEIVRVLGNRLVPLPDNAAAAAELLAAEKAGERDVVLLDESTTDKERDWVPNAATPVINLRAAEAVALELRELGAMINAVRGTPGGVLRINAVIQSDWESPVAIFA